MAIPAPVILLPTDGADYATDISTQTLSGTTSTDTKEIQVNGSQNGVSYTPGETVWAWTGELSLGMNILNIIAIEDITEASSPVTTITITLVQQDDFITVSPPTGVQLLRYQDKLESVNTQNPEANTLGYNYYVSTQSGGIDGSYVKINTELITDYSFYEDKTTLLSRTQDTAGDIRVTTITEQITRVYYYSKYFDQDRYEEMVEAGQLPAVVFNENTPFYFVITAVIYDPALGQVTESAYSIELEGSPLTITTGIQTLPTRTQSDIILTFSQELLTGNANIDTKPGTVLRDILDPISEEAARMYVIQDFMSRSLSVSALLDFDDANGDGVSDSVETSTSKRALQIALNLSDTQDVQNIIDAQFDKLGSNVNVNRRGATAAVGQVVYYIDTVPIRNMTVNEGAIVTAVGDLDEGIPSQSYETLTTKTLEYENREQYYNSDTGRYELTLDVQALNAGEQGNTDSYTVKVNSSGADSDFLVENPNPIAFGRNVESNHDFATRIELALFADTGTEGGYAKVAAGVPGVRRVRVEKAGDPLMIRDYDEIRDKHVGGKVDVYVQGSQEKQVTDQIAFSFESIVSTQGTQTGEVFSIVNAVAFQFKSLNPRVTVHTPIFEVTRVHNATRLADYDISGYQIIGNGNTIDLDESKPTNQTIGLASNDVIRVDYKFRSSDVFILQNQPVLEIISVIGQISGTLTTDNYELVSLEDPLENGGSTIASDGVRIKFANNLPLTEFQTITDESHVLILGENEALNYLGVDPNSIVVKNSTKTITYTLNVDYRVSPGTDVDPTTILMIESGNIDNGQQVLISYVAIENFTITYTTNSLLQTVQNELNGMKHACADVIAKQTIENDVDFAFTVIPKTGVTNTTDLTAKIRTAISNYVTQLTIGQYLTQSAVAQIIQNIADVDYVVLPFSRMIKADESFIIRDQVGKTSWEIFNEGVTTSYITVATVLTYNTIDQGGSTNKFRGVFEDTMGLVLQEDPVDVSEGAGRAYIRDDGKVIVSTRDGQIPDNKYYEVAYFVYDETGSEDINVASIESLKVGNLTIVYDTPREISTTL